MTTRDPRDQRGLDPSTGRPGTDWPVVRIGTRGSALALAQARWTQRQLEARAGLRTELVIIKTSGDRFLDRPLSDIGGKGLFVKEIEEALADGRIDYAVHSMKDLPGDLAPGLTIAAVPQREDPRDVVITRTHCPLASLPTGARLGTSSLRRMALVRALHAGVEIVPLRGNVDSRLRKLDAGQLDAILLAAAGMNRLGVTRDGVEHLDPCQFVPAIGQGALAIESRADAIPAGLAVLDHLPTRIVTDAERAFLARVGGSCHTPLAAHATLDGDQLHLRALIASPDGQRVVRGERTGGSGDAVTLGADLAAELLGRGGDQILRALGSS